MAEQKSVPFHCPLVKSKFLLRNSLGASQNHRKGGIFHTLADRRQGSATGREREEREQRGIESRNRLPLRGRFWTSGWKDGSLRTHRKDPH